MIENHPALDTALKYSFKIPSGNLWSIYNPNDDHITEEEDLAENILINIFGMDILKFQNAVVENENTESRITVDQLTVDMVGHMSPVDDIIFHFDGNDAVIFKMMFGTIIEKLHGEWNEV